MNPGWLWFWSIAWLVLLVIVILFNKGASDEQIPPSAE